MKKKLLEDYLKTIYVLSLDKGKIENEDIALILETEQSEVKKNIEELISKGYITYDEVNHKFDLTDKGLILAEKVYKRHELFEDFFKKFIQIGHHVAHIYSDVLEHISSNITDKRFEHLIKHYDYWRKIVPLTFLEKGESGRLIRIKRGRCQICRLYELGLCGNCDIKVLESSSEKGPVKIKVRGSELVLDYDQARNILVEHKVQDADYWKKFKMKWREDFRKDWRKHKRMRKMGKKGKKRGFFEH